MQIGELTKAGHRAIHLDGVFNMRDIGGLQTSTGRAVRKGLLYRADALSWISESDIHRIRDDLGISLILDLRLPKESERARSPLFRSQSGAATSAPLVSYVNISFRCTDDPAEDVVTVIALSRQLSDGYKMYVEHSAARIARAVQVLAEAGSLPAIIHCSGGKDRTGVLLAIILDAIGIEHAQIIDDYAATDERMPLLMSRVSGENAYEGHRVTQLPGWAFRAMPATMEDFLNYMCNTHGGSYAWLHKQGVHSEVLDGLRERLLLRADCPS